MAQIIGGAKNFWLHTEDHGYDLTHPSKPDDPPTYHSLKLQTDEAAITIDPKKTALVVVDLQNYFVSPALGRPKFSLALAVIERLTTHVIPACRDTESPVLWLGWGLTEVDIEDMPPAIVKGFAMDDNFEDGREAPGLGKDIGYVKLEDGSAVYAGKALVEYQWNSEFYGPLAKAAKSTDMHVYKNRRSGFWGGTETEDVLRARGIRTLIFSGCNVDQCIAASLMDAVWKGFDCLLLSDGCSTTDPEFGRTAVEYNMGVWGFMLDCQDLVDGVSRMD